MDANGDINVDPKEGFQKYIPERNYAAREYRPLLEGFDDMCKSCELYYLMLEQKRLTGKPFVPVCKRHVLDEFKDLEADDFDSQEEFDEILINIDPVSWAYKNFNWQARWYQEEMMSCTAQKKVVRAGRRTGKTTAIVMLTLWGIFTHNDWTVLVIAPYQSQVTKIFDEMHKVLQSNPQLGSAIHRQTKNPQRLELNNGSKVLGFSSGSKSASKSDKIRGQDANYIVLDEADYLDDADLEAILAILASHPDCGLWASSTPTGRHAKFYQWCIDKGLGFKEFHFISSESPSWTDDAESFFRSNFDAVSFEHEFLAEFGLQIYGVFRNDLVDACLVDYSLPLPRSSPQSRIVMGVDWNGDKNGVHIVIVEYDGSKYRVICKDIVKNDQFTQHASIDRILELDALYGCDFIYVDEGYGRVQVEMLHKMGMANPSTGLAKRVVPYAFNKPVEIRDPRTGMTIKKPSKPFLVNITTLQLEEGRIILPSSEDTQILVNSKDGEAGNRSPGLVQQMRNFSIERVSVLGLPTYSQGDDHTLFAFMLAIAGFVLEFSDLRKVNWSRAILATKMSGGGLVINSPDQENKKMADVVRQLDAGVNKNTAIKNISSVFSARDATQSLKKSIGKGDRKTISRYFNSKNINRGKSLDKPGRSSF